MVGTACASFVVEDYSIGGTEALGKEMIQERCTRLYNALYCEPVKF